MNKTDQVMKWVVGFSTAAALALGGWSFRTTASNETRISVVEERANGAQERLGRIEDKIDWLIQQRVREYRYYPPASEPERTPNRRGAP